MSIFARAAQKLNLTPAERAFLKVVEGIGATVIVAGGQVFFQELSTQTVNWQSAAHTALVAMGAVLLLALKKYGFAAGDPPLPTQPAAPSAPDAGALAQQALDHLTPGVS